VRPSINWDPQDQRNPLRVFWSSLTQKADWSDDVAWQQFQSVLVADGRLSRCLFNYDLLDLSLSVEFVSWPMMRTQE